MPKKKTSKSLFKSIDVSTIFLSGLVVIALVLALFTQATKSNLFEMGKDKKMLTGEVQYEVEKRNISHAFDGDKLYVKYHGMMYVSDVSEVEKFRVVSPGDYHSLETLNWYEHAFELPESHVNTFSIFDARALPNKDVLLVLEANSRDYSVHLLRSGAAPIQNPTQLLTFPSGDGATPSIPKIDKISADGQLITFNMYSCWGCDGGKRQKLVAKLDSDQKQIVNKLELAETADFYFYPNGTFSYRLKAQNCEGMVNVSTEDINVYSKSLNDYNRCLEINKGPWVTKSF